ncbi:MAG: DUF1566 domain-containing protein [Chromatiales bacterium]|nr:DUF1566 domain-containing protein [Chromatiales bacterium]
MSPKQILAMSITIALYAPLTMAIVGTVDSEQAQTVSYPIVDTGQTQFFDNSAEVIQPEPGEYFYGQDAHYQGNQPTYQNNANGTVTDLVTGLTWTKSPDLNGDGSINADDKLSFDEALNYPDTLNAQNYGGHNDWRLPTMKELYSLMNFSGTDPMINQTDGLTPFIDTNYFDFGYGDVTAGERIIDAQFWSSNAYVGYVFDTQSATFGLNLADGRIKGYPTSGHVIKTNYVYFVRGNVDYGINDFADNSDGTISDHATGLMWSKDDSGMGLNWEEALDWVEQMNSLNYLGYSDWRLPNAKEMQSIVDYSRAPDVTQSAAIDPIFNTTEITSEGGEIDYPWFWTGTTHIRSDGNGSAGVYICFGRATGYMNGSWMDVHGAGAQRSDQKAGNFTGYTYEPNGYYFAQSPQGDATRIYNYVRLVRGGMNTEAPATGDLPDSGSTPPDNSGPGVTPPDTSEPNLQWDSCDGLAAGDACTLSSPFSTQSGICRTTQDGLRCVPERRLPPPPSQGPNLFGPR